MKKVVNLTNMNKNHLIYMIQLSKTKNKNRVGISSVAVAAATIVILMVIPTTRTQIVNAATRLIRVFTANGQEITVEQLPNESVVSIDYDENKDYTLVQDGRLYLVIGNTKIDVTDASWLTFPVRL